MKSQVADNYQNLREKPVGVTRIPDLIIGALMAIPTPIPGTSIPINVAAAAVMLLLASLRRPQAEKSLPPWYPLLAVGLLIWVTISGFYNNVLPFTSMAYWVLFVVVLLVATTGRIDRVSLCRGLAVGLLIGAGASYANLFSGGVASAEGYTGRLTGIIWTDPNQSGYYLTVLGALALVGARPGWPRRIGIVLVGVAVVLTLSRTAIVAMIVAWIWFLLRRYQRLWLVLLTTGGLGYALLQIAEGLRNWGPFAQRIGSDHLRERIAASSEEAIQAAPWIGNGPGTSELLVAGQRFFFHNSYLSIRNIGGWILLGMLLLLIALVFWSLIRLPIGMHHPWHEAAIIATLVCASSLGEVLLRMPAALAIGLGMRHVLAPHELETADGGAAPNKVL